jgi:hypothetical protein
MSQEDRDLTPDKRSKLREFRLKALTKLHSGHRKIRYEVWRHGRLYRCDERNLLDTNSQGYTFVNINDLSFTNVASFVINRNIKSASLYQDPKHKFTEIELWQAYTIEPQAALLFLLATADTNTLSKASYNTTTSSFAGLEVDTNRVLSLIEQRNGSFGLTIQYPSESASEIGCFRFFSRIGEYVVRYWINMNKPNELYKLKLFIVP